MLIKVCGMRDGENIRQVAALGVDWIGMIFWPKSPRNVTANPDIKADHILRVGVFVDETVQNIATRVADFQLNLVQLHGHESPAFIHDLRQALPSDLRIIKAISVASRHDIAAYKAYEGCVDYFLFDTKCPTVGGSGQQFDWSVLETYEGKKPFLLSGGIGPDDVERIKRFQHHRCIGIDLNSRFETAPAVKDIAALRTFLSQITH